MISNLLLILLAFAICKFDGLVTANIMTVQARDSQHGSSEISQAVKDLSARDARTRSRAQKRLLRIAERSIGSRGQVVRSLVVLLKDPGARYETWSATAEILGRLKSTEALDILVKHLDANNGTVGFPLSHFPAVAAVVKIGEPAVPKLATALVESEPFIRKLAARALGAIGGNQAKNALEQALKTEKDDEVIWEIRAALSNNWK